MRSNDTIIKRLTDLIDQGSALRIGDSNGKDTDVLKHQNCLGWITASRNIVALIFPDKQSVYKTHIEAVAKEDWEWRVNAAVGEITAVLTNLRADIQGGLLSSIVDQTRAEVLDSFLDHARVYLVDNRKNEAGVISGVVFEDTVRRIARNRGIDETGKKLDAVISALVANGVISSVMAKRARVAAHVRTKATHAQWEEFDTGAVEATIAVTDELVLQNLDGQA